MKPRLENEPNPTSGIRTLEIGPSVLGQPSGVSVRLPVTKSEAAKAGILDRWVAARKKQADRLARKLRQEEARSRAATELKAGVNTLLNHASEEHWSQRRLAKEAGLSWGGWLRCRDGHADPMIWLPKVHAAVSQLTPI